MYNPHSTGFDHPISFKAAEIPGQIDATTADLLSGLDAADLRLIDDLRTRIPDRPAIINGNAVHYLSSAVAV